MKRTDWKFTYNAATLATAATAKRKHHEERLEWWRDQKKIISQKVSDAGIEVHESVADRKYQSTGYNISPEIRIDATLQRDLMECQAKIHEHAKKVTEYIGWEEVLWVDKDKFFDLDHEDFLFFFGK